MKSFFVFDVESIGLHGHAFAVAGGVYREDGSASDEFQFAVDRSKCGGEISDIQWVDENIPPIEANCKSPEEMRDSFWEEWMHAKKQGAVMAADCLWPVEAGFVARVVRDDFLTRKWDGPYPFVEISTYLDAAGIDPLGQFDRLESELPKHHPLADARQSARLLFEAIKIINSK